MLQQYETLYELVPFLQFKEHEKEPQRNVTFSLQLWQK